MQCLPFGVGSVFKIDDRFGLFVCLFVRSFVCLFVWLVGLPAVDSGSSGREVARKLQGAGCEEAAWRLLGGNEEAAGPSLRGTWYYVLRAKLLKINTPFGQRPSEF